MTFCIITQVPHKLYNGSIYAYAPYVNEMNIWFKNVEKVIIVAPIENSVLTTVDMPYEHSDINLQRVPAINILNLSNIIKAAMSLPLILVRIARAMNHSDHIHLRCPGNMGLLGSLMQIGFPSKNKTTKYAGNWDPSSLQPWSYRLQQFILSNTFLTRNMKVLVYGDWQEATSNIKSFFTASYRDAEKQRIAPRSLQDTITFIFAGSLSKGKDPMYAISLIERLSYGRRNVTLELYGEGPERSLLEGQISLRGLENTVKLMGNQSAEVLKNAFQRAHFTILPSDSEGWPKAIAEGMFWGCVPISTPVSCLPHMLEYGNRGVLIEKNIDLDTNAIEKLLDNVNDYNSMSMRCADWSQHYTIDVFENAVKELMRR